MPFTKKWPYWPGVGAIVLLAILYLTVYSYRYFWDALIDCYHLEQPYDASKLIHPQHPIFPFVFYNFFRLFTDDITGRSIYMLRMVSIIFSLIGLAAFYGVIKRITGSYFASALGALCVGLAAAWWHHSITGNTFIISAAFLMLSLYVFMWERGGKSSLGVFILHLVLFALAVMFHRFAFFFIIPFAFAAFTRKFNVTNSVGSSMLSALGYLIAAGLISAIAFMIFPCLLGGINTGAELKAWWRDYDGALQYFTGGFEKSFRGLFTAGLGSILALPRSANISFRNWEGAQPNAVAGVYYIILVIIGVGLFLAIKSASKDDRKQSPMENTFFAFNISALIIIGMLCTVLHPYSFSHHLFLIPVVVGILTLWFYKLVRSRPGAIQLLWLIIPIVLFCNNWYVKFEHDRDSNTNPYIYLARKSALFMNPGDLLIDSGVDVGIFRHAYRLYFAGIESHHFLELPGFMEEDARKYHEALLEYQSRGNRIILHESAVENEKTMLMLLKGMGSGMSLEAYQEFAVQFLEPQPAYFVINEKRHYIVQIKPLSEPRP